MRLSIPLVLFALVMPLMAANCDLTNLREENGFWLNPTTSEVFNKACEKQEYTFDSTLVINIFAGNVNPFQPKPPERMGNWANATYETAAKVAAIIREIAPGSKATVIEFNYPGCSGSGTTLVFSNSICLSKPWRLIQVYPDYKNPAPTVSLYGGILSAGEAANMLMRNPATAKRVIAEDVERALGWLQRSNGF